MICHSSKRYTSFLLILVVVNVTCGVNGQLCQKVFVAGRVICRDTKPFIGGYGRCARSIPSEPGLKGCGFIGSICRCKSGHVLNMVMTNSTAASTDLSLIGR